MSKHAGTEGPNSPAAVDAGGQAILPPQSSHAPDPIATTARPAAFNADRIRVTSAGLNPDEISAVLNAEQWCHQDVQHLDVRGVAATLMWTGVKVP